MSAAVPDGAMAHSDAACRARRRTTRCAGCDDVTAVWQPVSMHDRDRSLQKCNSPVSVLFARGKHHRHHHPRLRGLPAFAPTSCHSVPSFSLPRAPEAERAACAGACCSRSAFRRRWLPSSRIPDPVAMAPSRFAPSSQQHGSAAPRRVRPRRDASSPRHDATRQAAGWRLHPVSRWYTARIA